MGRPAAAARRLGGRGQGPALPARAAVHRHGLGGHRGIAPAAVRRRRQLRGAGVRALPRGGRADVRRSVQSAQGPAERRVPAREAQAGGRGAVPDPALARLVRRPARQASLSGPLRPPAPSGSAPSGAPLRRRPAAGAPDDGAGYGPVKPRPPLLAPAVLAACAVRAVPPAVPAVPVPADRVPARAVAPVPDFGEAAVL